MSRSSQIFTSISEKFSFIRTYAESVGISIPENKNPWGELFKNYRSAIESEIGKKNINIILELQKQDITITAEELSRTYQFSDEDTSSVFANMILALNCALCYELLCDAKNILIILTKTAQEYDEQTGEFILSNKIELGANEFYWLMSSLSNAIIKFPEKAQEILKLATILINKCSSNIFENSFSQKMISGPLRGTSPLYFLMYALCNSAALEMWSVMRAILTFSHIIIEKCSAEKLKISFSEPYDNHNLFYFLISTINNVNIKRENNKNTIEFAISLIDKMNFIPFYQKDNIGFTLLHWAVLYKNFEAIEILLKNKADPNALDFNGKSPLHYALDNDSTAIINLIMKNNGNPILWDNQYHSPLKYAVSTQYNHNLFSTLLLHKHHLQELYLISKIGNKDEVALYLDKHFDLFLSKDLVELENNIEELECLFLRLVNEHFFIEAEPILHQVRFLTLHKNTYFCFSNREEKASFLKIKFKDCFPCTFPDNISEKRQEAIINAFEQITNLFSNPQQCIELLKELDEQIKVFEPFLQCDFSTVLPGNAIRLHRSLKVPSSESPTIQHTHGLLHFLIRKKLQSHGVEKQNELYTFSGFVNSELANSIIRNGSLFKEQFLMGNSLIHGIYSHYLQWYVIAAAIEKNILVFQDNITLRDLLSAAVEVKLKGYNSIWERCFDFVSVPRFNKDCSDFNIGSPHRLNSLLFFADDIPHLRGYLVNSFLKNILKFRQHVKNEYQKEISYLCIVGASAISYSNFNLFYPGYDNNNIKNYYHTQAKTGVYVESFGTKSGILIKSAKELFALIEQQYNILFPSEAAVSQKKKREEPLAESFFSKPAVKSERKNKTIHISGADRKKEASVDILPTAVPKTVTGNYCSIM